MQISNRLGLIGVVLAVVLGLWLDGKVPKHVPGLEDLAIHVGALFLGLFALTVDRCEVPGLLASYRANLQNFFATAAASGLGTYDKPIVPGRRMAFFVLPLVVAPLILPLIGMIVIGFDVADDGKVSQLDFDRNFTLPMAGVAIWAGYAWATRGLRRRIDPGAPGFDEVGFH
jgi:hypothetical protein